MNPSEDLLSLGGNQLLFLCSRSPIFAVAKASRHAVVRHRSHWPARPSIATPEGTNTPRKLTLMALKAHTSTQKAHRALKAHTSTPLVPYKNMAHDRPSDPFQGVTRASLSVAA
jgi:hypothetical protein